MPSSFSVAPYIPDNRPPRRVTGEDPNGPVLMGLTFTPDGGMPIPLLFPPLPSDLAGPVSAIILNWSLLDTFVRSATAQLLKNNHANLTGWRSQEIARVLRLHREQFEAAFQGHGDLLKFHEKEIMARVWKAKLVRDLISHAQIIAASADKGPAIRFVTTKLGKKSKRLSYADDLGSIAGHISAACGFIDQLFQDPDAVPASLAAKSALRQILDKDRWTAAIDEAMRPPS